MKHFSKVWKEYDTSHTGNNNTDSINMSDPASKEDIENMMSKLSVTRNTRYLEPSMYGGTSSENASEWLSRFENYAQLTDMQPDRRLLHLKLLLRGIALCWFQNLSDTDSANYDTVIKRFKDTFMSPSRNYINIQRLESLRLGPNENCETFVNQVLNLSNQIGLTDKETAQTLLRALPGNMRAQIVAFNPTTLEETIQRIYLAEASLRMQKKEEMSSVENTPNTHLAVMAEAIQKMNDNLKKTTENLEQNRSPQDTYRRTFYPRREENTNGQQQNWDQRDTHQYRNTSRPTYRNVNDRRCYTCGSANHLYRQCPSANYSQRPRQFNSYNQSWNRNNQMRYSNRGQQYNQQRNYRDSKNVMLPRRA